MARVSPLQKDSLGVKHYRGQRRNGQFPGFLENKTIPSGRHVTLDTAS
jgi:hypothetical protein